MEAAQERLDKAKVVIDALTPSLAALVVEETALANAKSDSHKEMEAHSTKKRAVITPPVEPTTPAGRERWKR